MAIEYKPLSAALPIPVPPCPVCATALVLDGDRRSCPRCGRAFTVKVVGAALGSVYREAPGVDLVPARHRAPVAGLSVGGRTLGLEVSIGNPWGTNGATRAKFALSMSAVASLICLLVGVLGTSLWGWIPPAWAWVLIAIPMLLDSLNGMVSIMSARDRITIETVAGGSLGSLVWTRRRGSKLLKDEQVALSRVTGVHDAADHIRVDLDDGSFWEIGKGLNVPRRVRRWVAGRVAELLPLPPPDGTVPRMMGSQRQPCEMLR